MVDGGGVFEGILCYLVGIKVKLRWFEFLWVVVEEVKLGRMYVGFYYKFFVDDGVEVG